MNDKDIRVKLYSYDHKLIDKTVNVIKTFARDKGCGIKGPIPLPTRKEIFTICRSVHVDKPSREQFERRTHKRLIILTAVQPEFIKEFRNLRFPTGVAVKI